jgi:hypothetical protein
VIVLTMALSCYCAGSVPAFRPEKGRSHGTPVLDTVGIPPTATKTGCASFDVRLGGARGVMVTPVVSDACGAVQVTLEGNAILDTARRLVQLPVALHNPGIVQLHPPVALLARPGGLAVTAGAPSGGALRYVRVDSMAGDSMRTGRPDARWVFDRSLDAPAIAEVVASDGVAVIPAGGTSGARFIGVAVPRGVTAFRVTLNATGAIVFTVPAQAPDHVPLDEVEDSRLPGNIVTNDPRIPGRVVRNKLWLLFRDRATPEQRQAAIDVVQGVVIGGRRVGPSPYYYLRIPANPDSAGGPLAAAIRTLAVLPQVQHVMPDLVAGAPTAR